MISFRFHVVSITAIFLAIAIGVVVGSTYVDGAVVDGLRNRIKTVGDNLEERRAENERLEGELGSARSYIDESDEFAVTDRLTDVPVLLLATRGIDEGAVEQIAILARRAGAVLPGVVWMEPRWGLQGDDERSALADIVDGDPDDAAEDLWSAAWESVVAELRESAVFQDPGDPPVPEDPAAPEDTTTTTDPPVRVAEQLGALAEGGFVTVDTLDDDTSAVTDLVGSDPSVLVLTGTRAREELRPMLRTVIGAVVDGGLPIVVADVYVEASDAPGRGQALAELLSQEVREAVFLVDDADRPEGWVGTVLVLDAAGDGLSGQHFGYGEGADAVLPAWTPP
ncbi:MAG: copper transporter [Acidimicrobiales bacterium]